MRKSKTLVFIVDILINFEGSIILLQFDEPVPYYYTYNFSLKNIKYINTTLMFVDFCEQVFIIAFSFWVELWGEIGRDR